MQQVPGVGGGEGGRCARSQTTLPDRKGAWGWRSGRRSRHRRGRRRRWRSCGGFRTHRTAAARGFKLEKDAASRLLEQHRAWAHGGDQARRPRRNGRAPRLWRAMVRGHVGLHDARGPQAAPQASVQCPSSARGLSKCCAHMHALLGAALHSAPIGYKRAHQGAAHRPQIRARSRDQRQIGVRRAAPAAAAVVQRESRHWILGTLLRRV